MYRLQFLKTGSLSFLRCNDRLLHFSIRERKIEMFDAYVHARLVSFVSCGTCIYNAWRKARHNGYNEVLLTPRCGISISLSTAASYRYYSSCVVQDVLLLSSSENERVRSGRPFACIWRRDHDDARTGSVLRVTAWTITTHVYTRPDGSAMGGAGSHVLIIALPFIGIIAALLSPRSARSNREPVRVFSAISCLSLLERAHRAINDPTISLAQPSLGYFQLGIFKPKYH